MVDSDRTYQVRELISQEELSSLLILIVELMKLWFQFT